MCMFYLNSISIQGRQGKAALDVLVDASETGDWLALQVTWAIPLPSMCTDKTTKIFQEVRTGKDSRFLTCRLGAPHYAMFVLR